MRRTHGAREPTKCARINLTAIRVQRPSCVKSPTFHATLSLAEVDEISNDGSQPRGRDPR